jgi:hypothetical protein
MYSLHLEAMGHTSFDLLNANDGRNVALIMGFPIHINNQQALESWIHS